MPTLYWLELAEPTVKVQSLGHVVVKVRSVQRSEDFYSGVLDIPVVARISDPVRMTFFSLGSSHHDGSVRSRPDLAKSMHVHDPDGNEVELYIDTSDTRNPFPDAGPVVATHA